jgi:hypothetical protein
MDAGIRINFLMRIKKDDFFNACRRPKAIVEARKFSGSALNKNRTR